MLAEAIAAINRAIIFRLERNLCLAAAVSADHREHLALFALSAVTVAATLVAAITATGRLVLEALLRVKFLLACAKDELLATVLARQRFVFKSHEKNPLTFRLANLRSRILPTAEIKP